MTPTLPTEIQCQILRHVGVKDLLVAACVSKVFQELAEQHLYYSIKFHTTKLDLFRNAICSSSSKHRRKGDRILKIICMPGETRGRPDEVGEVLSFLPRLKDLSIKGTRFQKADAAVTRVLLARPSFLSASV
ncbi:hypothetical protein B0H14DRAFT_2648660 [Mycena olivaceomarginata]|nr:hypothetical protein B0H14DRAFT_2648660 [Mycena olivaceomarginata]